MRILKNKRWRRRKREKCNKNGTEDRKEDTHTAEGNSMRDRIREGGERRRESKSLSARGKEKKT